MPTNWKERDIDEQEFDALQKAHGVDSRKVFRLSDKAVKELRKLYQEYLDTRRSFGLTSAYGNHYLFLDVFKRERVPTGSFGDDSQLINQAVMEAITYGQVSI